MALTGFVGFMAFTDLGLGVGLQNSLSESFGRDDDESPREYVSSALAATILLFVIISAAAIFVIPNVPLDRLIKVRTPEAAAELVPTAQCMLIVFACGLPLGFVQRIYHAYQKGYMVNLWLAVGRVAGLLGVLFCVYLELGLPYLVTAIMGLPAICLAIAAYRLFIHEMPFLSPSMKNVRKHAAMAMLGLGVKSSLAQLAYLFLMGGPVLIISNRIDTAAATPFSVTQRMVAMSGMFLATAIQPLWPAYSEAKARGDLKWIAITFRRSLFLSIIIQSLVFGVCFLYGRDLIRLWAGVDAVPSQSLLMAVNVWYVFAALALCNVMLLNGLSRFLGRAVYGPLFSLLALALAYYYAPRYLSEGVIWATVLIGVLGPTICTSAEVAYFFLKKARCQGRN